MRHAVECTVIVIDQGRQHSTERGKQEEQSKEDDLYGGVSPWGGVQLHRMIVDPECVAQVRVSGRVQVGIVSRLRGRRHTVEDAIAVNIAPEKVIEVDERVQGESHQPRLEGLEFPAANIGPLEVVMESLTVTPLIELTFDCPARHTARADTGPVCVAVDHVSRRSEKFQPIIYHDMLIVSRVLAVER